MKKEVLSLAVANLRTLLSSDCIVTRSDDCLAQKANIQQGVEVCSFFKANIVGWLISGKGNFDRLSKTDKEVAEQLGVSGIYKDEINSIWVPYWANCPSASSQNVPAFVLYLQTYLARTFIEAHRRIMCLDDVLKANLHTKHDPDECVIEVVSEDHDPSIESVERTLQLIRDLAKIFCSLYYPDEEAVIQVTYLDMGSNYQVGIKVDAKAEIGPNITKFLTQILKFITNPRAFIQASRIETLGKKVEAFQDIQKKVSSGEISFEAGQLFAQELFGTAKKLAVHGAFPAQLIKEHSETNTVQEFRALMTEGSFQAALPEPKLALPQEGVES